MADRNFLEVNPDTKSIFSMMAEPEINFNDFDMDMPSPADFKSIKPTAGFCIKSRTDNNEKLFINVCHSEDIPPPPASFDLSKIISPGDNEESLINFPMSLGEPHLEIDKTGHRCNSYDVVINSEYYQEVSKKNELRDFITTLACSGLERKYSISIDVGTCVLLNKRYHGTMPTHFIRLKSASNSELDPINKAVFKTDDEKVLMPVKKPLCFSASEIIQYNLFRVSSGNISFLVFQGITKDISDKNYFRVFVAKRTFTLQNGESKIILKMALPFDVIPDMSMSNFRNNRLIVCMFVNSIH